MNLPIKKYYESPIILAIFFFALILSSPVNLGEIIGAETWKPWAASKLLLQTGKFIQYSLGPLYYTFLTLFNSFDYKNSIILEYFITHLFCLFFIYELLKIKSLKLLSILFVVAWIPFLASIQSPKYLLAIGFLCLHFSKMQDEKIFKGWFPPYLLCAILCNWGYILFLTGHIFGKIIDFLKVRKLNFNGKKNAYSIISAGLIIFFFFSLINNLDKPYNNQYVSIYNHAPIKISSPFKITFFQMGNHHYIQREFGDSKLVETDWYFTNKYAFKDCKSVACAIIKSPKTVVLNLRLQIGMLCRNLTLNFFGPFASNLKFSYFIIFLS